MTTKTKRKCADYEGRVIARLTRDDMASLDAFCSSAGVGRSDAVRLAICELVRRHRDAGQADPHAGLLEFH